MIPGRNGHLYCKIVSFDSFETLSFVSHHPYPCLIIPVPLTSNDAVVHLISKHSKAHQLVSYPCTPILAKCTTSYPSTQNLISLYIQSQQLRLVSYPCTVYIQSNDMLVTHPCTFIHSEAYWSHICTSNYSEKCQSHIPVYIQLH